jgi:RNA polymerase sigma-70 factor (ECF subfamily)
MNREGAPAGADVRTELERIVRRQRARLIGLLVRELGTARIDVAEDVAQEALLAAVASWPYSGLPEHPEAWLARVARNKAVDRLRRRGREVDLPDADALSVGEPADGDPLFAARVPDASLRLAYLCCHGELEVVDRLALMLRLVCGFTAGEIARLLLLPEAGVAQRLVRARRRLRALGAAIASPPDARQLRERLDPVYLAFSLGHAPRTGAEAIRRDVMEEAIRLARLLADDPVTARPQARALAALLCLQGARIDARVDEAGLPVLLRDQDRGSWREDLVSAGVGYLRAARSARTPSRYHIEAAIAAAHTLAPSFEACDWNAIVTCYEALGRLVDSPVVAVNGAVARAHAGDPAGALAILDRLRADSRLEDYAPYHLAPAEVQRLAGPGGASAEAYRAALAAGTTAAVAKHIETRLASCL